MPFLTDCTRLAIVVLNVARNTVLASSPDFPMFLNVTHDKSCNVEKHGSLGTRLCCLSDCYRIKESVYADS